MNKDTYNAIVGLIVLAGCMLMLVLHPERINYTAILVIGAALFMIWLAVKTHGVIVPWWDNLSPRWQAPIAFLVAMVVLFIYGRAVAQIPSHMPPPVWSHSQMHLPPVEFDKPYKGKLTIETVTSGQLQARCAAASQSSLGCSFPSSDSCRILLVDEATMRAIGWTREVMLRHEIAHCNGWPQSHAGIRPYRPDTKP